MWNFTGTLPKGLLSPSHNQLVPQNVNQKHDVKSVSSYYDS